LIQYLQNWIVAFFKAFLRAFIETRFFVIIAKFISSIISNNNYEFYGFNYAPSFPDIQVVLKTPKHLILALYLTKIGTSLLIAQNLCFRHYCKRVFLLNWNKNTIFYMQCCLKQHNRWFMVNQISLLISGRPGSHWERFFMIFKHNSFKILILCRQSIKTITFFYILVL
jgi:hypothetical protein